MRSRKPKVGRPKLPKGQVKEVVAIRLTPDERSQFEAQAKHEGISLSDWIRRAAGAAIATR
jgi:hypothetical protein